MYIMCNSPQINDIDIEKLNRYKHAIFVDFLLQKQNLNLPLLILQRGRWWVMLI